MHSQQVISTSYGQQYSFYAASIITVVHAILLLSLLPETRGRTLTEIQRLLDTKTSSCADGSLITELRVVKIVPRQDALHLIKGDSA